MFWITHIPGITPHWAGDVKACEGHRSAVLGVDTVTDDASHDLTLCDADDTEHRHARGIASRSGFEGQKHLTLSDGGTSISRSNCLSVCAEMGWDSNPEPLAMCCPHHEK